MVNTKNIKSNQGMTLVESLVTILIFSVIISGIYTALITGTNSWNINKVTVELQQDARIALARMKADLIQSSSSAIIDVPADGSWYTTITFRIPDSVGSDGIIVWPSETIQYLLSSNQLIRQIEDASVVTEQRVIAENMQTLQVRRLSSAPHIVEISLQTSKVTSLGNTITLDETVKIYLRN